VAQALKIVNYGGADIIEAFEKILTGEGPAARKTMHQLADALSARIGKLLSASSRNT